MRHTIEDPVFRVMRTMSRAEIVMRYAMWSAITVALFCVMVGDALLFAAVCNGAVSPWALPFSLVFGAWLTMAGPRAGSQMLLYLDASCELTWWDEWRERNGLSKEGE